MARMELPDPLQGYEIPLLLAFSALCLFAFQWLQPEPLDPREPPLIKPSIPFIGHLIGVMRYQSDYFDMLSDKSGLPIFTVYIGTTKMYHVVSPNLIQTAIRHKGLSFDPVIMQLSLRQFDSKYLPNQIMTEDMKKLKANEIVREETFMGHHNKALHKLVLPGPELYSMNAHVLSQMAKSINKIGISFESKCLYVWLRDTFTEATTTTLFGSRNPFAKNPSLVQEQWIMESGFASIILSPFPSITARRPYLAQTRITSSFNSYFQDHLEDEPDVSAVIKARVAINRSYGMNNADIARLESQLIFAATANALPTLFWLYIYLLSDPVLAEEIKVELLAVSERKTEADGKSKMVIDVTKFIEHCPLLVSSYQETLRLARDRILGTRIVVQDTLLTATSESDGKTSEEQTYLLKKGILTQLASHTIHSSASIWGPDYDTFNGRRFYTADEAATGKRLGRLTEKEKIKKRAWTPFGGGKHLCPGRYFAFAEILGTVAMLLLGFETVPEEAMTGNNDAGGMEKGREHDLESVQTKFTAPGKLHKFVDAVVKPDMEGQGMKVGIRRRKGWENVTWAFEAGAEPPNARQRDYSTGA